MNNRFERVTKPLMWSMALLLVAFVAGCSGRGNDPILGGIGVGAGLAPTVTSTVPANAATGVQINRRITATFSESTMDAATITAASFKVTGPLATAVPGAVIYAGQTAVFTPTSVLAASSLYTATVTTVVKNQAGIAMLANHVWSFTTGLTSDTTAPKLISVGAADGATDLPINRDATATFSEPMLPSTLVSPATNFTVCAAGTGVAPVACASPNITGVVTYLGNTATFNPDVDLSPSTWYTLNITTGAMDLTGVNALVPGLIPNPWSWKTAATPESTAPTVTFTNPADLATLVPVDRTINATFSEAMSQATMVTANFTVHETATPLNVVAGTVAYDAANNIASFLPQTSLTPDTDYTVTVSNGAKDLAGNALVVPAVGGLPKPNPWTFRTAPASVPPVALAINLGSAASYGIAARAGMTSSGVTVVNGDIALYPLATCTDSTSTVGGGAAGNCTGFTDWADSAGMTVNGSIYWAGGPDDLIAQQVTNDLNTAWIQGKNKIDTFAADSLGGQLGGVGPVGKTIVPGVYTENVLNLATGWVATFDANDDPNAVFIIRVTTSFSDSGILATPSEIKLARGAQAKNIWFVIGSAASIGTGTIWNGNILAGGTITISGGSTVTGRLLAGAAGAGAFTMTTTAPAAITINVPE